MKALLSIFLFSFLSVTSTFAAEKSTDQNPTTEVIISQGPHAQATYNYNFGNVPINYSRFHNFSLVNNTNYPVYVYSVYLWGQGFYGWSGCSGWLYPWQRCNTQVEFRPWNQGYYTGRLTFNLSTQTIYINLYGWGYWY